MGPRDKAIAITRPSAQSASLRQGLEVRGFRVVECPAIEIVPVDDWTALDTAIASLPSYDWLLLTSANAADLFFERLKIRHVPCTIPIVVVGSATAERVLQWHHSPALQPDEDFRAEGVAKLFPADLRGQRVLFPRAESAREMLPEELRRRGAFVDVVAVYSTRKHHSGLERLRLALEGRELCCVVFTSPSAVQYTAETFAESLQVLFEDVDIAVLGPIVRQACQRVGLTAAIEPEHALTSDLIEAIDQYFSRQR